MLDNRLANTVDNITVDHFLKSVLLLVIIVEKLAKLQIEPSTGLIEENMGIIYMHRFIHYKTYGNILKMFSCMIPFIIYKDYDN